MSLCPLVPWRVTGNGMMLSPYVVVGVAFSSAWCELLIELVDAVLLAVERMAKTVCDVVGSEGVRVNQRPSKRRLRRRTFAAQDCEKSRQGCGARHLLRSSVWRSYAVPVSPHVHLLSSL
jgi:hypothetical protein